MDTTERSDTGLVKQDCIHNRQEYISFSNGIEFWVCLKCGEVVHQHIDCYGG